VSLRPRSGPAALACAAVTGVVAFVLFLAGGALLWANGHYKDADGYWSTGTARFETGSRALTTRDARLAHGRYGTIRLTARGSDKPLFVGIARTKDVDAYLRGVPFERVRKVEFTPFHAPQEAVAGSRTPAPPAQAGIWAASGREALSWPVEGGDWSVVVMNADGSAGVSAEVAAGAKVPALYTLAWALLALALGFVVATALLTLAGTPPTRRRVAVAA
jgi:hypothetical protein